MGFLAKKKDSKAERKNKDAFIKSQKRMVKEQRDKYELAQSEKRDKKASKVEVMDEIKLKDAKGKAMFALQREKNAAGKMQNTLKEKLDTQRVGAGKVDTSASKEAKKKEEARKSEEHELRLMETQKERTHKRLSAELLADRKEIAKQKAIKQKLKAELGKTASMNRLKTMVAKYGQKMREHYLKFVPQTD